MYSIGFVTQNVTVRPPDGGLPPSFESVPSANMQGKGSWSIWEVFLLTDIRFVSIKHKLSACWNQTECVVR